MDKLKSILHPGGKKDDEVMYGDQNTKRESASRAPAANAAPLYPVEDAPAKEHGILRQVFNPGDAKYDETRYGTTATTQPPPADQLQTLPEHKKDHTIVDQILNPDHEKYDERRFAATAYTTGDRRASTAVQPPPTTVPADATLQTVPGEKKHEHTILRQILNPHGENYDEQAYGQNAEAVRSSQQSSAAAGTLPTPRSASDGGDASSCLSIKSGQEGPFVRQTDSRMTGTGPIGGTTSIQPTRSTGVDDSHVGRDVAVAGGAGAVAGGAGAYAASEQRPQESERSIQPTPSSHTSTIPSSVQAVRDAESQPTPTSPAPLNRDTAAAAGIGAAAGTGAYGASQHEKSHDSSVVGTTHGSAGIAPEDKRVKTAFDDSSYLGRDTAVASGVAGAGAGAGAAGAYGVSQPHNSTRVTDRPHPLSGSVADSHVNPINPPEDASALVGSGSTVPSSHVGRDAAIAGGVGAAGAGIYAASQEHDAGTTIVGRPHPLHDYGTGAHINPVSAPETPETGLTAAGTAPGAGIVGASGVTQLNRAPTDVQNATYTDRAFHVGGSTGSQLQDTTSRVDPHVPGEFPAEDGTDRHGENGPPDMRTTASTAPHSTTSATPSQPAASTTAAGAALAGAGIDAGSGTAAAARQDELPAYATQSQPTTSTATDSTGLVGAGTSTTSQSQPVANTTAAGAALAGAGVGAGSGTAGPGPGALGMDRSSTAATSHPGGPRYPVENAGTTGASSSPAAQTGAAQATREPQHDGRDAALAGGAGAAGAAGVGGYELAEDSNKPAAVTGPHSTNVANAADNRVHSKPEDLKTINKPNEPSIAGSNVQPSTDKGRLHERNVAGVDPQIQQDADELKSGSKPSDTSREGGQDTRQDPAVIAAQKASHEHEHNKLQKPREEDKEQSEKKPSLIQRILHPGRHTNDTEDDNRVSTDDAGHSHLHKKKVEQSGGPDN